MNNSYIEKGKYVFVHTNDNLEKRKNVNNIDDIVYQENVMEQLNNDRNIIDGNKSIISKQIKYVKSELKIIGVCFPILILVLIISKFSFPNINSLIISEKFIKLFLCSLGSLTGLAITLCPCLELIRLKKSYSSLTMKDRVLDRQIELEKQKLTNLKFNSKEREEKSNDIITVPEVNYNPDLILKLYAANIYSENKKRLLKLYKDNRFNNVKLSEKEKAYIEEIIKEDVKVLSKVKK